MSEPHQKTVLVTGATGFIGRRLCSILDRQGASVVELRRPDSGTSRPPAGHATIAADLADQGPIMLPSGVDTIFHLAGKAHALSEMAQDDAEYARINRDGTRQLLEAAQRGGVRAFIFFSSVKAIGPVAGAPIDETKDAPPDTPYGRSKREAEELVLHGGYVPHPVVLRPTLVYGPGVLGNLEKMAAAVQRGRFPPLPEVGNKRSMVHVDDLITAAMLAAENPAAAGRTYIVADNAPCSTRDLFVWMCEAVGRPVPGWTIPVWMLRMLAAMGDGIGRVRGRRFVFDSTALDRLTGSAWYSPARLEQELGWTPRHTVRESLPQILGKRGRLG